MILAAVARQISTFSAATAKLRPTVLCSTSTKSISLPRLNPSRREGGGPPEDKKEKMKDETGERDSPENLRALARRARFLASHLPEPDKSRIEVYAAELERLAEQKERSG